MFHFSTFQLPRNQTVWSCCFEVYQKSNSNSQVSYISESLNCYYFLFVNASLLDNSKSDIHIIETNFKSELNKDFPFSKNDPNKAFQWTEKERHNAENGFLCTNIQTLMEKVCFF